MVSAASTSPAPRAGHLVLVGPTASGKSAAAVELALLRNASGRRTEIVSCDSMAVYRGMDIGTATPTMAERAGIEHHLIDVAEPTEEFTVSRFVGMVDDALARIEARGASAVLVGGTGLYVQAVVDRFDIPGRFPEVAAQLDLLGTEELTSRLQHLDPVAAERVPPGNRRRLIRALEVTIGSGRPFSQAGPGVTEFGPTPFVLTGLMVRRTELTARITERCRRQVADGFLDEVRALATLDAPLSRTAASALGYRELLAHLAGELGFDEAVERTIRRTRRFAVRQQRWFARDPRIRWFDATSDATGGDGLGRRDLAERIDAYWIRRSAAVDTARTDPS